MDVAKLRWESILLSEDVGMGQREYLLACHDGAGKVFASRTIIWREFEHTQDYIVFGVEQAINWMMGRVGLEP